MRLPRYYATITVLFLIITAPFPCVGQRAIPDDNLAYPVLVTLTDCFNNITEIKGSGFFLNTDTETYFVTARHVLFDVSQRPAPGQQPFSLQCGKADLYSFSKNAAETTRNHFVLDLRAMNAAGDVKAHVSHDVAVVRIGTFAPGSNTEQALVGVQAVSIAPAGILGTSMATTKKLAEVLVANDIYVLGYPSSIGLQQAPQIDYTTPLLRKGIVAGVNASNKTIVLDCLTFFGNSGGPVLEMTTVGLGRQFSIIGVISQYVPVAEQWVNTTMSYGYMQIHNSGYSIAEPMDAVLELIQQRH